MRVIRNDLTLQDFNSPSNKLSTTDSDLGINSFDVNSSSELKARHKNKSNKRSAFFGNENPLLSDESDSETTP